LITASPANSGSGSGGCNSLAVNGSTAYVEAPNSSSLNIAGALTMEAWIKLPAVSTTYQPIIDKSPSVGNEGGYDLWVTDTGKARMDIFYSPSYQWLIGNTTLTAGVWHHIAGVYDGSQLRLYVDGQLDGSVNLASAMTGSTVQLRIGKNNYLYGPLYFNGLIDEVRISTGALYSSNFTPPGTLTASSSTKGLWKFDGQTTNDSSSNGNNGSLNGGATYSNDVPAGGGGGSAENVTWTNAMGVSSNGNSLTATANGWTAGASSTRAIMSGDGYVQFTASETSSYRMMALSHGDANQSYEELDFAFYLGQNGYLYIYENNVPVYFAGFYASGDTLRIAVESGVVKYRKNGAVVYTSTATPTYPLLADASLSTAGSTINNVVLSGNLGSSASTVQWLVADHLGTPRMILDEWGNLAAMKRHDYLPFGEELFAPTGGRTAAQGYSAGDGLRQKFTQKERDIETGLDYFLARYYSSNQGRFTGVDRYDINVERQSIVDEEQAERTFFEYISQPQQWNRYSYAINNPLKYIDPLGEAIELTGTEEERTKQLEELRKAVGKKAGAYLYENKGTDGKYYVGIYTNGPSGKGSSFENVNSVAGEIGAVIRDTKIVGLGVVANGTQITPDGGTPITIGTIKDGNSPGLTTTVGGKLMVYFLESSTNPGKIPGTHMYGTNGKDGVIYPGEILAHELGHARALMTGDLQVNKASLRIENKVRALYEPKRAIKSERWLH
jgi:RHS repeat-associated protein